MFNFIEKHKKDYEREILKQTNPYMYYIENLEMNKQGLRGSNPCSLYGEKDIKQLENPAEETETHRVYSFAGYFLFENKNGFSTTEEKIRLISAAKEQDADLAYSDSDKITETGERFAPFFKQNYFIDSYNSYDYISEFYAVKEQFKNTAIGEINNIYHIEDVLYHGYFDVSKYKGKTEKSTLKLTEEAVLAAVYEETVKDYKEPDYMIDDAILSDTVSVVIPSKDNVKLLKTALESIRTSKNATMVQVKETVVVDNGSSDENKEQIEEIIESYKDINAKYIYQRMEFNFSRMCNNGANETTGDYLLFMNDDIEVIDELFLLKLLYYARKSYAGCVAPKLLYPDGNLIQHVGLVDLKLCGPSHILSHFEDSKVQYYGANRMVRNMLALTGACLMVSRVKYFKNNGFCDKMEIGYNDVDLCICMYEMGYLNIQVNDTVLYHHESVTRGSDTISEEKFLRLKNERNLLYERHPFVRKNRDPFYNKNFPDDSIAYKINIEADADKKNIVCKRDNILENKIIKGFKRACKIAHMNIENKTIERGIFDEEDVYIVSGWAVLEKRNNALFDRSIVLKEKDTGNIKAFEMLPVYREDVKDVFPTAKNALLAGFKAKIPLKYIDTDKEYETGVIFTSKITKKRYYAG